MLGGILYTWGAPRLEQVTPAADSAGIPAGTAIRLRFSRPMDTASVERRLAITPQWPGRITWQGSELIFTPQRPWPNGARISVRLEAGAFTAGWLPLTLTEARQWSFTIGQPVLAYLFPADAPADLYSLEPPDGEIRRLTRLTEGAAPGGVLDYSLDASGSAIYLSAQTTAGSAIFRLERSEGAEPVLLLDCPAAQCRYPQVSPAGDLLVFERTLLEAGQVGDRPQVLLLALANGLVAPEALPISAGDPAHRTQQPAWSSAGWLVYYDFTAAEFVLTDPRSGAARRYPSQSGLPGEWSPDGLHYVAPEIIAPESSRPGLEMIPTSHLLRYAVEGGPVEDLTRGAEMEDVSPAHSPDGLLLAFARKRLDLQGWTPGRQLWLMLPDGSQARQLTRDDDYTYYGLAWSPDSAQLAYMRFNQSLMTDPPELWLLDAATLQARQLILGGHSPRWIP